MSSPHDALHSKESFDEAVRYSEDDRHALEGHYRKFLGGDYFRVQHEKVSHKVHVDIYIYGATVDRPYVTLATSGMGAADVSCGEHEEGDFCHPTEMVTYVPHDWDFSSFESQWLMRRLIDTARYPHEMQSVIAKHQTWCMYDEKTGLADALIPGSIFTHWYFRSLIEEPPEIDHLVLPSGRHVDFVWPYPITRHELHFLTQSNERLELDVQLAAYAPTDIDINRQCLIAPENREERRARRRNQKKLARTFPEQPWMTVPCAYPHPEVEDLG